MLVPSAAPEVSLRDVTLATPFLGHELAAPLVITGMTGGHADALVINRRLGELAQRLQIAVGVGSQRAALVDPSLADTYAAVRKEAPDAVVIANLGASQLVAQGEVPPFGPTELNQVVEMVGAQVLAIHLNVVEELIQPEGDRITDGYIDAIAAAVSAASVPVMVKETGAGMDRGTAERLVAAGVAAIDAGGLGGTNFARVETKRAVDAGEVRRAQLGETFGEWGIPTAAAILEVRDAGVPVVATGGVRSGLHAAKAIALGADLVGLGRPMLIAAVEGGSQLQDAADLFLDELRTAMVLTGCATVAELKTARTVLRGLLRDWNDAMPPR